jgi:DNA helicase-2/ATP-dependent DNA helicase PcrA
VNESDKTMKILEDSSRSIAVDPLAQLNEAQRAAATFGILQAPGSTGDDSTHRPLLVIAGAGSGKTSTLAHRVAQLVAQGADPERILLLTFSRRAANEMNRRVERILTRHTGACWMAGISTLAWSGTFHGIGARLLREYAGRIGLDRRSPSMTGRTRPT